jgi:hypothetical protein
MNRRAKWGLVAAALIASAVAIDEVGYRVWKYRFGRFDSRIENAPVWQEGPRNRSSEPNLYGGELTILPSAFMMSPPDRFALRFEPPWYVWRYHLGLSSRVGFSATEWAYCRLGLEPHRAAWVMFSRQRGKSVQYGPWEERPCIRLF